MKSPRHTPGPWAVRNFDDGMVSVSAPFISNGRLYGSFDIATNIRPDVDRLKHEREANAHLIAAAPELLAALEIAITYIVPQCDEDLENLHRCRAAIDKATNKTA